MLLYFSDWTRTGVFKMIKFLPTRILHVLHDDLLAIGGVDHLLALTGRDHPQAEARKIINILFKQN